MQARSKGLSRRPTKSEIAAAAGGRIRDVIGPGLRVLFVGINPSLYSAAVGHHFGRPGNRFWPTLHKSGHTPRLLLPHEDRELLTLGYGLTNFVARATARADELADDELVSGAELLVRKVRRVRPKCVAVVGISAYRVAFGDRGAQVGRQAESLEGALLWVLPNPSGLNAHYQLPDLVRLFRACRLAAARYQPIKSTSR